MFRIDRCLVYIGYINKVFLHLDFFHSSVYREFRFIQGSVYTEFHFIQGSVYTEFCFIQGSVYTEFRFIQGSVYTEFCFISSTFRRRKKELLSSRQHLGRLSFWLSFRLSFG